MPKLNVSALKKLDSRNFNAKKEITLDGYSLVLEEKFRPTAIKAWFAEYQDKFQQINDNPEIDASKVNWSAYMMLLMVKHFTSLEVPDEFDKQLTVMELLVDNNMFMPIIEAFNKDEMNRFWQEVQKMQKDIIENLPELMKQLSEMDMVEKVDSDAVNDTP